MRIARERQKACKAAELRQSIERIASNEAMTIEQIRDALRDLLNESTHATRDNIDAL